MPDTQPSPEAGAPVPTGPDGGDSVEIALGPDHSIYPETLRPAEAPPAPPVAETPEPAQATAPEDAPDVAGTVEPPTEGETRGTRRRAAEDAYNRGLAEGRAAYEREQQQRMSADEAQRVQREASQRVEQLFDLARSPDPATQRQAWNQILSMYDGNRQAQQLTQTTRQQVLLEMAAEFGHIQNLDGVTAEDYQALHAAPSAAKLVEAAIGIGKRLGSRDEDVARLEAELQGLRGRLVGTRATPEASNGNALGGSLVIEDYQAMSPKDARKLTPAQIDALTAQLAQDAARNGRSY